MFTNDATEIHFKLFGSSLISFCIAISLETFQMGKIHKDIAMFMVDAAKNEDYNDQKLVKVTRCLEGGGTR